MALCCVIPNLLAAASGSASFTFFKPLETTIGTVIASSSSILLPKPYKYFAFTAVPIINGISYLIETDYSRIPYDLRPITNSLTSAAVTYSTSFGLINWYGGFLKSDNHAKSGLLALSVSVVSYALSNLAVMPTELKEQKIIGDNTKSIISGGQTFKAADIGSCVFSIGKENSIIFGAGKDIAFFSLCSTKYISAKIPTIYNFGKEDIINLFCTKTDVKENTYLEINLKSQDTYFDQDYTLLTIHHMKAPDFAGKNVHIAVMGHHPNLEEQISYNIKWNDYDCPITGQDSVI